MSDGNADGNADLNSTVNGKIFPVIGHVGDVVTINATSTEISTYLALYDGVEIIQANTLDSLFGTGDDFVGLSGKPSSGDNILVWDTFGGRPIFITMISGRHLEQDLIKKQQLYIQTKE